MCAMDLRPYRDNMATTGLPSHAHGEQPWPSAAIRATTGQAWLSRTLPD